MPSHVRLSPHFTFTEMTATAVRQDDNTPNEDQRANLVRLCVGTLEPLRARFGPLYTTSGFRSEEVNRIIGGSSTSAHKDGRAWDGVPLSPVRWADVFAWLKENGPAELDQVIWELGRWIHVGITEGPTGRRQFLAMFSRGKYEPWNPTDSRVTR